MPLAWWEYALVLAIFLCVVDITLRCLTTPFLSGDAIAFWTPKAKVFYEHRYAPRAAFGDLSQFLVPAHPPFVPLTETWTFLWMGNLNEYGMKLIFPLYATLLLAGLWAFSTRLFGRRAGLIATALLAASPILRSFGTTGYVDVPLAFFYLLASASMLVWFQTRREPFLLLGAIFAGLTGWLKNEGLLLALLNGCVLGAFLLSRRRQGESGVGRVALRFAGITLGMVAPWLVARQAFGLEYGSLQVSAPQAAERVWPAAIGFAREMFSRSGVLSGWNLGWYLFAFLLVVQRRAVWASPVLRYCVFLILGHVLIYFLIYLVVPTDLGWSLRMSLTRLLLHVYPLVVLLDAWLIDTGVSKGSRRLDPTASNAPT